MKCVKFSVTADDSGFVEIVPFGDVHVGNPFFDEQKCLDIIDYVMEKPNRYMTLCGDLIENNIKTSPGSVFEQTMSITSQIGWICAKLQPVAAAGKIICYTPGNHEYDRSTKEVGIAPSDIIISNLIQHDPTIKERYCPDGAYVFLRFFNVLGHSRNKAREPALVFTMYQLHGAGGSTRLGAKVNRVQDMMGVIGANIYLHAHTHESFAIPTSVLAVNNQKYSITEEEAWLVNCNSFIKYGGYASRKAMKPTGNRVPVISLFVDRFVKDKKEYNKKIINVTMR